MYTNALKVLRERGFIEWSSHGEELEKHFAENMVTGYVGFDPSADSLHVGNLVAIMGLAWLQRLGHRPIALAGGGTGRIGDPSGKSAERNLLAEEQILHNVGRIAAQLRHFLDFDCGENSALLLNNNDWLKKLNYIEFLRDIGKFFSVSFLVNREMSNLSLFPCVFDNLPGVESIRFFFCFRTFGSTFCSKFRIKNSVIIYYLMIVYLHNIPPLFLMLYLFQYGSYVSFPYCKYTNCCSTIQQSSFYFILFFLKFSSTLFLLIRHQRLYTKRFPILRAYHIYNAC